MEEKIYKVIKEDNPVHTGYVLYICPICKNTILNRKIGEPLNREFIYCKECGSKIDLK